MNGSHYAHNIDTAPPDPHPHHRRGGDDIEIRGDYQYRALTHGHPVQRYWHASKLLLVDRFLRPSPSDKVIDVGCGSGVVADHIASKGAEVVGVDTNPSAIAFATQRFGRPSVEFRLGTAEDLPFPNGAFTKVVFMEVLEHLSADEARPMMSTLRRLLAPRGLLLVTTPNYGGIWPFVEALVDRTGRAAHMAHDQHVSRYDRSHLQRLLEGADFTPLRIGTYCTIAPFLAPFSRPVADRYLDLELRGHLPFGNVLYGLAAAR